MPNLDFVRSMPDQGFNRQFTTSLEQIKSSMLRKAAHDLVSAAACLANDCEPVSLDEQELLVKHFLRYVAAHQALYRTQACLYLFDKLSDDDLVCCERIVSTVQVSTAKKIKHLKFDYVELCLGKDPAYKLPLRGIISRLAVLSLKSLFPGRQPHLTHN